MSAALTVSFRQPVLPWAGSIEDDIRFARVRTVVLVLCALLCAVSLLMPVLQPERAKPEDLPLSRATLILENLKLPPPASPMPPAPTVAPKPAEPVAQAEAPPQAAVKPAGEPPPKAVARKEAAVPEAREPVPDRAAGERDAARRKAAGVGLLAMSRDLADMRGAPTAVQLGAVKQGPGVGSGVGVGVGAGTEPGLPNRALITSNASSGSGGINTAVLSSNSGGGGLAGRATTLVAGVAGGGGGGGAGGGGLRSGNGTGNGNGSGSGVGNGSGAGGRLTAGSSGKAARSIEEIKLVFERNKGAIYAIYNRALREEPGLQGKVVLELKIAPSGSVIECRILSSELRAPELEAKLLARIRQFDFSAKDVDQMVVTWPVDFLPS